VSCVPNVASVSCLSIPDFPFLIAPSWFSIIDCPFLIAHSWLTLGTQDTGRRQTKQINVRENWRGKNGQARETGNIGYTRHGTKTNKTNNRWRKLKGQEWTSKRHWQHWTHNTRDEDKQNTKI
jgi:hypothetical protein